MSSPMHPSSEELSAYQDRELGPDRRSALETHLAGCPQCRALLEEFAALEELGTDFEQSLPGAEYWLDLPDRVLARIAASEAVSVAGSGTRSRASLWWRLWNPQGTWRWAAATAVAVVVMAGAWMAVHQSRNPVTPLGDLAEQRTMPARTPARTPVVTPEFVSDNLVATAPGSNGTESAPAMNPDSFAHRVVVTLGGENNLGTSLDMESGRAIQTPGATSLVGTPVSFQLPPLAPQARKEMQGVLSCGPGESSLQRALVAAAQAEETGNTALARQGYLLVRKFSDPSHPLYREADFRLTYCQWRQRLLSASPGLARARILVKLQDQAQQSFRNWVRTGRDGDCQEAWRLNRTLVQLKGITTPSQVRQASLRLQNLARCMDQ